MGSDTRKPVLGISNQAIPKPACSATEPGYNSGISFVASLDMLLSNKLITKALIRLHGCAGWTAPLLFTNPQRQVFSLQVQQTPMLYGPRREKPCLRGFANNKGTDQPEHPRRLISTFIIRFLERIICNLATGEISIFSVTEEIGLKLALSKTQRQVFSRRSHIVYLSHLFHGFLFKFKPVFLFLFYLFFSFFFFSLSFLLHASFSL